MRVVLNSDVLYSGLITSAADVPAIMQFFRDVAAAGGVLIFPRTTLLELERRQKEAYEERMAALSNAARVLGKHGVAVPTFDPAEVIRPMSLPAVLQAEGIPYQIEDPDLSDYRLAEHRACLHLPPGRRDAKSDEMRDLVIWAVACRIAKTAPPAMLVSRDHVHSGELGAEEADAAGLLRAKDFDEALELLGREGPSMKTAKSLLSLGWQRMRELGLPLAGTPTIKRLRNPEFAYDAGGRVSGRFGLSSTHDGATVSAEVAVAQTGASTVTYELADIAVNGTPAVPDAHVFEIEGTLPTEVPTEAERLGELKAILGGGP